jgi:hypothetical protein
MKKISTLLHCCLIAAGATIFSSCEKEKLDDVLSKEQLGNVQVSVATKTDIGTGSNFTLTGGELTVPVTVEFSSATAKAFTIQLSANSDTVGTLITAGTLASGTVPISSGSFSIPTVLNVPIGVTSTTFNLVVSRSFLEVNYGKTVALALKMTSPAKGNTIAPGKSVGIITIKTSEAIAADAVHYIGFSAKTLLVPTNNNFRSGSQDLIIDIPINLTGVAGPTFTVDVAKDATVSQALIATGGVTNAAVLPNDRFTIGTGKVIFDPSKNTATMSVNTNLAQLLMLTDKKWLIGLTLSNPTKYQTGADKKSIVVVIDANYLSRPYSGNESTQVRPYDGTPFLISGTVGKVSEFIPAAIFDLGGEGVGYHNNNQSKNGASAFRPTEFVDIVNEIPRRAIGWTESNEWLNFTVNVEADGIYDVNAFIGSSNNDGRYSILVDGVDMTGVLANKKTGNDNYGNYQPNLSTFAMKKGRHIVKFFMNRGAYDFQGLQFTRKS